MATGTEAKANAMFDDAARYAALEVNYTNLGQRVAGLEHSMNSGFSAFSSKLDNLSREISTGRQTPWATIIAFGVLALGLVSAIGGLAYLPIKDGLLDAKASITDLRKDAANALTVAVQNMVTRQEIDMRAARAVEDRSRIDDVIRDIRQQMVPRDELNARHAGSERARDDIQRQINEMKGELSFVMHRAP